MSMSIERDQESINTLKALIVLAQRGEEQDWQRIDEVLPNQSDNPLFTQWAKQNLMSTKSGLQDLAASILEQSSQDLDRATINNLFALMSSNDIDNPYPSFRAACALARHKENDLSEEQVDKIKLKFRDFLDDSSVSEIANSYLAKIEN